MLCKPCEDRTPGGSVTRRPLRGVRLGAGSATLAHLARFGLAVTGEALLEPKRGST